MVNNKGPGGGEKESGNGLVHAMQHSGPQAKYFTGGHPSSHINFVSGLVSSRILQHCEVSA